VERDAQKAVSHLFVDFLGQFLVTVFSAERLQRTLAESFVNCTNSSHRSSAIPFRPVFVDAEVPRPSRGSVGHQKSMAIPTSHYSWRGRISRKPIDDIVKQSPYRRKLDDSLRADMKGGGFAADQCRVLRLATTDDSL